MFHTTEIYKLHKKHSNLLALLACTHNNSTVMLDSLQHTLGTLQGIYNLDI